MTGAWVIFEGPDGAGKSSLADRTCRHLADSRGPTILQHLTPKSEYDEYYGPPSMWSRGGLNVE